MFSENKIAMSPMITVAGVFSMQGPPILHGMSKCLHSQLPMYRISARNGLPPSRLGDQMSGWATTFYQLGATNYNELYRKVPHLFNLAD